MKRLRAILRFLRSPRFVLSLLLLIAALAALITLFARFPALGRSAATWLGQHPGVARALSAAWLNRGYASVWFLIPVGLLFLSTVLCAFTRTNVAFKRYGAIRRLRSQQRGSRAGMTPVADAAQDNDSETLRQAAHALRFHTITDTPRGFVATSNPWALFASPLFHWCLVALLVVIVLGQLTRAEGLMGIPVGASAPFVRENLVDPKAGPWHSWSKDPLVIAVTDLFPTYKVGKVDRGPTPVIELSRQSSPEVLKRQTVYPNHVLTFGSLTIHANNYGLAPTISFVNARGEAAPASTQIIDFNAGSPGGAFPAQFSVGEDPAQPRYDVVLTLVQKQQNGKPVPTRLKDVRADLTVTDRATAQVVASGQVAQGEALKLPTGASIRFDKLAFYARLSVVDDWSVPYLYALLIVTTLALGMTFLFSPRVLYVARTEDGKWMARVNFYRPTAVAPQEVYDELAESLSENR